MSFKHNRLGILILKRKEKKNSLKSMRDEFSRVLLSGYVYRLPPLALPH